MQFTGTNTPFCRYRFQYDGRLQRSFETGTITTPVLNLLITEHSAAVMLMETFNRLTRKDKYVWDVSCIQLYPVATSTHLAQIPDVWPCTLS